MAGKWPTHRSSSRDDQQNEDADDEDVGRNGEHASRFAYASQVAPRHDRDEDHGQRDPVVADRGAAETTAATPAATLTETVST